MTDLGAIAVKILVLGLLAADYLASRPIEPILAVIAWAVTDGLRGGARLQVGRPMSEPLQEMVGIVAAATIALTAALVVATGVLALFFRRRP